MPNYVGECMKAYLSGGTAAKYVTCVFDEAKKKAREKELVSKATKALVELSRAKGPGAFINLSEIQQRAGFAPRVGLWPWLEKEADVVEKRTSPRAYRIKSEFYDAMLALFPTDALEANRRGLLGLQGLGKEVWAGIDAQAYVDRERSAWAG